VQYEDRLSIATPEGVILELTLAGPGSRLVGALIDGLLMIAALAGVYFLFLEPVMEGASPLLAAFFWVFVFLLLFGYHVFFEVLNSGRTVGKLAAGLRVVRLDGGPVSFRTSVVRNVLRIVDVLPGFYPVGLYVVGVISVLVTARNQRVGDLAAGTLVVRDPHGAGLPSAGSAYAAQSSTRPPPDPSPPGYSGPLPYAGRGPAESYAAPPPPPGASDHDLWGWDVSAITVDELATVRRFLERRGGLDVAARRRLAGQLVERLAPKVAGAPQDLPEEAFLERLARAKAARS
jgi:uncharacterized RDD family membrane protein YckC